jgi:hypothetical protein
MLMTVPDTLTDAINAQPASIILIAQQLTSSSVRDVPYDELYRSSTGVRETPAQRLQRIAREDPGTQ